MFHSRCIPWILALAFVAASCDDPTAATHFDTPGQDAAFSLQSGSTAGSAGFHFLPPLMANTSFPGTPDMGRSPRVEICEVTSGPCTPVQSFTGSEIRAADEHYQVLWDAGASPVPVKVGVPYRIQVSLGLVDLGRTEIVFEATGSARRANSNQEVGINRTVPIRFRIEAGTLAAALQASECDVAGDDTIDDCDVVSGTTDEEITSQVRDPKSGGRVAGVVRIPEQTGALAGQEIVIVQKLLVNPVAGASIAPGDQVPFFLQVEIFGADGERVTDAFVPAAYLALCQPPEVASSLIPFLSIFRYSNGTTQILDTSANTPECHASHAAVDLPFFQRMHRNLGQVAGLLRARPLRALHGGLNTTTEVFSEFGAVIEPVEAPFGYGGEFH